MLKNEVLKAVLDSPGLPTLPTVASKLISVTSKPETSISEIVQLLSKDISLSAKVLRIANSAFYGFSSKIGTVHQAVTNMGKNAIRSLVLSVSFLEIKANEKQGCFRYEKFWQKSLSAAVAAKLIMSEIDKSEPEEVFIAALLQNIGELILVRTFPEQYERVLKTLSEAPWDVLAIEDLIIGANHAFIGHEVCRNWGFPAGLLFPILYHHNPEGYPGNDNKIELATKVVYLSGLIANVLSAFQPQENHDKFIEKSKTMLGFNDKIIDGILEKVHSEIIEIATFFDLHIENPKPIELILQEANIALSLINLSYEQINKELISAKIELQKLTKDLEQKNKQLEKLVHTDGLTEIYNHRYFQNFLETEIRRSLRKQTPVSLILIDIDHFKSFNDKYGHQTGDSILKETCKLIKNNIRDYDIVARYGGEEFAIVLVETTQEETLKIAEKLRQRIASNIFNDGIKEYRVTASFGVATVQPSNKEFKNSDLIAFADKALYESKKKGRNRVTAYTQKRSWF